MFQGIRSPEGFDPLWLLFLILFSDKDPSRATWIAHRISGVYVLPFYLIFNGPTRTNNNCEGESAKSCKSLGLFL